MDVNNGDIGTSVNVIRLSTGCRNAVGGVNHPERCLSLGRPCGRIDPTCTRDDDALGSETQPYHVARNGGCLTTAAAVAAAAPGGEGIRQTRAFARDRASEKHASKKSTLGRPVVRPTASAPSVAIGTGAAHHGPAKPGCLRAAACGRSSKAGSGFLDLSHSQRLVFLLLLVSSAVVHARPSYLEHPRAEGRRSGGASLGGRKMRIAVQPSFVLGRDP
jgi:hypothetical protein